METFWEYMYDGAILAIKVLVALIVIQIICSFFEVDFHIPWVSTWVEFVFTALKIH